MAVQQPPDYTAEIAEEARAMAAMRAHGRAYADLVVNAGLDRLGDGFGGAAMEIVAERLSELGVAPRTPFSASRMVERLAWRDGWLCHYCGDRLGWGHPSVVPPEIDHVVPRSQQGGNAIGNLVLACGHCNNAKGGRTPAQWLDRPCCGAHR